MIKADGLKARLKFRGRAGSAVSPGGSVQRVRGGLNLGCGVL